MFTDSQPIVMRQCVLKNSIVIPLILFLTFLFSSIESVAEIKSAWGPNTEDDLVERLIFRWLRCYQESAPFSLGCLTLNPMKVKKDYNFLRKGSVMITFEFYYRKDEASKGSIYNITFRAKCPIPSCEIH